MRYEVRGLRHPLEILETISVAHRCQIALLNDHGYEIVVDEKQIDFVSECGSAHVGPAVEQSITGFEVVDHDLFVLGHVEGRVPELLLGLEEVYDVSYVLARRLDESAHGLRRHVQVLRPDDF